MNGEDRTLARGLVGGVLIVLGVIALIGRLADVDIWRYAWPLFILVPGALALTIGLTKPGGAGVALTVPGSIFTALGLLLLYQAATSHWESWAYAWALVAPGSLGAGLWSRGVIHDEAGNRSAGRALMLIALSLFVALGLLLEAVVGISDRRFRGATAVVLPVLAILLGLLVMFRRPAR